jgi:hypothetical protein
MTKRLVVNLQDSTHQELSRLSAELGVSMSFLTIRILTDGLADISCNGLVLKRHTPVTPTANPPFMRRTSDSADLTDADIAALDEMDT